MCSKTLQWCNHKQYWLQLNLLNVHASALSRFSCVQLFATPQTGAWQAPLSMGFSRQENWSRLPFSSPADLPHPAIEPAPLKCPTSAGGFFTTSATWGLPSGLDGKESITCNMGDLGSISGLGRSPGGGHDNSLQHSCWESHAGYGPWGCKESELNRHYWVTKDNTAQRHLGSPFSIHTL